MTDVQMLLGNCREVMRQMEPESVHMCMTSPPFWGLRDYQIESSIWYPDEMVNDCDHEWGDSATITMSPHHLDESSASVRGGGHKKATIETTMGQFCCLCSAWRGTLGLESTPELYVEHIVEVFREVWRVMRSDGTLWLNLGDSYNAGRNGGHAGGLNGVSKPENAPNQSGVNAPGLKPKDLVGIPWRVAFALQADGWYLRSDIIWHKPNPMPESVTDRLTKSHEYLFLLTKSPTYFYDADAIREPHTTGTHARGGVKSGEDVSFLKSGKASKQGGWNELPPSEHPAGRNKRTVWTIPTQSYKEAHFASFPEKLVEPCILAGTSDWGVCAKCGVPYTRIVERVVGFSKETPKMQAAHEARGGTGVPVGTVGKSGSGRTDGYSTTQGWRKTCKHIQDVVPATVLDPFGGSGTVALVALKHRRRAILIDMKQEYLDMAQRRLDGVQATMVTV